MCAVCLHGLPVHSFLVHDTVCVSTPCVFTVGQSTALLSDEQNRCLSLRQVCRLHGAHDDQGLKNGAIKMCQY